MNNECAICLTNDIVQLDKCITQCNHNFCKPCLDTWFDRGKNTCPMCRQRIRYFTYNGSSTRIISIDPLPTTRNINPHPVVAVTLFCYNSMKYLTMLSAVGNILALYIITQDCDI